MWTRLLPLLIIATAVAMPMSAAAQTALTREYVDKGIEFYRLEDYKEAIHFFQLALAKEPSNPYYHSLLGSALFKDKQLYPAIFTLKKGLELDPGSVHLLNNLGTVYRDMKLTQQAEDSYRQAIASNAEYPDAWRNLGVLYAYDLNRPKEAIECWQTYLRLAPAAEDAGQVKEQIKRFSK